jgi:hypothetical protein
VGLPFPALIAVFYFSRGAGANNLALHFCFLESEDNYGSDTI